MASIRPSAIALSALAFVACRNEDPEAFITSHVAGDVVTQGWAELFTGRVTDDKSELDDLTASWFLDGEEICGGQHPDGTDVVSCESLIALRDATLSVGEVELSLEVADPDGVLGAASVLLDVRVSDAPVVEIVSPDDGLVAYSDTAVTLAALVSDDLDSPEELVVWWESDLDGPLSPESAAAADGTVDGSALLTVGGHILTLFALDTTGVTGSASVEVSVFAANTEPECAITAPTDGSAFESDTLVTFTGQVSDFEDAIEDLVVTWSSDVDGDLGAFDRLEGGEVELLIDSLSLGTHAITLAATDTGGLSCSSSITYTVGSTPTVEIELPEDGSVSSQGETVRFQATVGDATDLAQDLELVWSSSVNGWFSGDPASSAGISAVEVSDLGQGAHTITLTATDSDGFVGSDSIGVVVNGVPDAPTLSLSPDPAYTVDGLEVTLTSDSTDPEGDTVTYTYAWTVDGVISSASTGQTLPASVTDKDEVWEVSVTPNDGLADGEVGTAAITISNTAPVLTDVALTPEDPVEGETLTCTPGTTTDADGDTGLTYAYAWEVDGSTIAATTDTLGDSDWDRGQSVACIVTPSDGTDDGASVRSNTLSVDNTAPEIVSASISPDPAQAADTLTCTYVGYVDADGDSDQSTYAWDVDGTTVGTAATLSGAFVGGETVTCTVTPDDGTDTGTDVSASLVISNTAPSVSAVSITPTTAYAGDQLVCSYTGYADDDGDPDQSTYAWSHNGTSVGTGSSYEGSFIRDDVLACTVTPDDGEDTGPTVSASVTITNTAPAIVSVSLSPTSPQAGDTLVCTYSGYEDADGDADASTYGWTIDGVSAGSGTDSLSSGFTGGELVVCTVTPDDGTDAGTAVTASATIGNTAPTVSSVSISPSAAAVGDTLTCSYSGYADADGDADASTYAWTVNGAAVSTSSTLSSDFLGGDTVTCTVTPYDGKSTGTSLSDSLVIDNTAPSISGVTLDPSTATTGDTLSCSYTGYADVDGDADQSTYVWTINGSDAGSGTTLSSGFVGGDTVACTVTPDDGEDTGIALSDSLTVDNTAPSISSVTISPSTAQAADTLSCSYSGYSDPDGNADQSTYAWTVDGSTVGNSSTLSGAFVGGETVTCTVTPSDGSNDGTALSDSLSIDNTAPTLSSVSISPSSATTSDALACSHSGYSDADGNADQSTYAWSINGSTVSTDTTLSSGYVGGDTVTCTVTPDDGEDAGTAASDSLIIDNTPPEISSVSVSPSSPTLDDTLTCSYSGFSDADGESDSSTYAWTVDGTTVGTSDTLAGAFLGGDTVTCTVTPNDGNEDGTALADSVVIDNTEPSISSVTISPSTAQAGDTLTCSYSGYSDPDGDADQSTYAWDVDGTEVSTTDTLSGSFVGGETVTCTVTPDDGSTQGTALSDSLLVDNTEPSITSVTLSPSTVQVGDTLTCSYSGYGDADGDSDVSTYGWTVNGSDAGVSTDALSSGFVGGDEVICTVVPDDGEDTGVALSDSLTVTNTAPSVSSVAISPTSAQVGDTLTCSYSGFSDADGDSDSSTYSWTVGGTEVGTSTTLSTGFSGGDTVTCTVTPHDGEDAGTPVSDSLAVGNTAPSIASVSISPTSAQTGDTLTCGYSGFTDADGDSDASTHLWTVDGSTVSTAATLSTDFVGGDTVTCTVTPNDGQDAGSAMSDSLSIDNTAPELTSVAISPTTAQAGDTLTCSHSGYSDADGDADQSSYVWDVDGTTVSTDTTLSSGFVGGESVTCTVTPDDGTDTGTAGSDSLVVDNTAPSITSVSIGPTSPAVTDDLVCSYSGFSDADGDSDASTYAWTVNGSSAGSADTLPSGSFASGDTATCTVTPHDGEDAGTDASASITIGNSAPSISSVAISPTSGQAGDTLTCTYNGYSDADGDGDQSTYRWTINGSTAGTSETLFSGFVGTDTVTCTVTPYDGNNTGTAVSDSITIDNSAPSVDSVSISPTVPVTGDTLTCAYSGFDDPDGDSDASTYAWTVDGTSAGTGATLASGFVGGQAVTCTVTPSDGTDDGTDVSASVTVDNTAPSITSVSISPSTAQAGDTLTCAASGFSDADGDSDLTTYAWTISGSSIGSGSTVSSGFVGGDSVVCTAVPSDGEDVGTALTDSITISNTAPVLADVSLGPDPAYEGDTLTCTPGSASDADGDTVTYSYAWSVGGSTVGETGSSLADTFFSRDEDVVCTVTPTDETDAGASVGSDTLTISNSVPSVSSVSISPASPAAADTLTCSYTGFSDGDGDSDSSTYSWTTLSGTELGTTSTLSGNFSRDDTVVCTVTPSDGTDDGAAVSESTTIVNTAPSISSVSISPTSAQAADTLSCSYSGYSDTDGDADQSTYAWTVNGSAAGASSTLTGAHVGTDVVICEVTPSDGDDDGTALSDSLTIDNTVPVLANVSLTPTSAAEGDTLTCTPGSASDDDGDSITYSYAWDVDGSDPGETSSTLSSSDFDRGEAVTCSVTPSDTTGDGAAVDSGTVTIANTAPAVTSVAISPSSPTVASTLSCTYSYSDADGDADSSTYSWTVGGTEIGTSSTLSSGFTGGDAVVCTVTPDDGTDTGTADSASVDIDNTAPSIASVSISPTDPTDADTLTCTYSGFSDADGDSDQSTYSWTISGTEVGTSSTLGGGFSAGDSVTCTVTPDDGTDAGAVKTDSVTITASNSAPVVSSVTLSPSTPTTDSTITVSYTTSDADGDTVSVSYAWFVNDSQVSTSSSLPGTTFFDKSDSVYVSLTPNDGSENGTTASSSTATVANTAPGAPVAAVTPEAPDGATEDIWCYVDTDSSDDDGDAVTYTFTWDADGSVYPDDFGSATGPDVTTETDDTIPAADTSLATDWTCTITPDDGTDSGSSDTAVASVVAPYTWDADVSPILQTECVGCHVGGASSGGVNFDSYATVVDSPSSDVAGMDLIEPGDTANSYMWHKLNNTQGDVGGAGGWMPLGTSTGLDAADLAIIETWITEGAAEN